MGKRLIDPRLITVETIARACDASVARWIELMRHPEDWMLNRFIERNVAEWVASAARNSWVIYDNCDANMVVAEAMYAMGLQTFHASDDDACLAASEGEDAYNQAIRTAVAHHGVWPHAEPFMDHLRVRHAMNDHEIDRFVRVLASAPADGLELACQRALAGMHEKVSPANVSGVSDTEFLIYYLRDRNAR